ncbi:MAG: TAXI family TRAP transporter solute-binding subunit [Chloroflexi bacterium]|nr:TAXI family TRAP transporter solute-binding subunit [Chloroflexota bacterium]
MYSGLDPAWKDTPQKDAQTLWLFEGGAQAWFVREDSGLTNVEQLHGKDFNAGGKGSGSEVIARLLAFLALGVEPKWYTGGYDDALAALKDRRIVGLGKATAVLRPDALIQDAMTAMKIRLLSWTPEQIEKVRAKHPFLSPVDIPAGTYKATWNEKPVTTWGDGLGMYTLAKFSDELAYQFTKAAVEDSKLNDGIQASAYKAMAGNDLVKTTIELAPIPLHAGSHKYFQEIGVKIPDHLKAPEAK